jgi:hypothetical protein
MKARLFWGWKYKTSRIFFTSHDALRLGIEVQDFQRVAMLEEGHLWSTHVTSPLGIALDPKQELFRSAKAQFEGPTPTSQQQLGPDIVGAKETPTAASRAPQAPMKKSTKKKPRRKRNADDLDATAIVFVDEARLADLRQLTSANFDVRRLIALCGELNVCYRSQCYFAVAALTRTLLDHVPPVFQAKTFAEGASNYAGGRSFKASMKNLENSARNIADGHLHTQIRKKESLPTRTQVNFAADVDVLLAEIVRILS